MVKTWSTEAVDRMVVSLRSLIQGGLEPIIINLLYLYIYGRSHLLQLVTDKNIILKF